MNTKILVLTIILMSFSVSSCGMKRALTLPKKEEQQAQHKEMMQDLAGYQPIDVLKTH